MVDARGQVLVLGAPLGTLTLLHHAEAVADVPNKRRVTYQMPVLEDGRRVWRTFHDIDTRQGAFPYEEVIGQGDAFEVIAREASQPVAALWGAGASAMHDRTCSTPIGSAFAVEWLESRFAHVSD